jgi:hypothetical protein
MTEAKNSVVRIVASALTAGFLLSSCTGVSPNEEQWQRARTACIQVGLSPESSAVGSCAARMQAAVTSYAE